MIGAGGRGGLVAAALCVAVLALGCTGDDAAAPVGDPSDTIAPGSGGVMRVGLPGAIVLDPTKASLASPSDQMVLDLLHDGLTRVGDDGVVQPALAAAWEHNDDLTAWRFHLASDASFTSGRPVTADDVIASIERVALLGDTSLVALSLEAVSGFRAFVDGSADHLAGLTAVDSTVVRFALDEPLSVLPAVVATPALAVVDVPSLAAAAADGATADLDLTGSWLVSSAAEGALSLERRAEASGSVDGVEVRSYADADAAYDAFTEGDVDWASVPTDRFDEVVDAYGDDHVVPFHAELFFGLHLGSATLANPALRQAIEAAIDREAIVTSVYADLADPLATVVPAGVPGHDPERCGSCGPDPERAAALVAEAFPGGTVPIVNIDYDESTAQSAMAEMIAADLEAAGIPTKLRPLPLEDYKRFVVGGTHELFTFGWIGAYTSPDAYLAPLFVSDSDDNLTAFRSADVDGFLSRARGADDDAKNAERWALAERAVMDAAVVIPIAQFRTQVVVADRVEGLEHAVDGTVDWVNVSIDE